MFSNSLQSGISISKLIWRKMPILLIGTLIASPAIIHSQDESNEEDVFELSPFIVDASDNTGYYASQTLAGGRLSTEIINTGSSIEVVTPEFMEDIAADDIEELLQYTTSTEVGGILGNFVGIDEDIANGNINSSDARNNLDENTRIRGIAPADRTRNFFKTDISLDGYNTERIDINRGSNSFLFGLGSPGGVVNSGLSRAHFKDKAKLQFRLSSGGEDPSYKTSIDLNKVIIDDVLAIRVAGLRNEQKYRQEPTYKDDKRFYGTITLNPFKSKLTTIRAHFESGETIANPPDTLLPVQALDTWVDRRLPIDVYENTQLYKHPEGISTKDFGKLSEADQAAYLENNYVRDDGGSKILTNWGASGYAIVFDGSNGVDPGFGFQPQMGAKGTYKKGDSFWDPNKKAGGNMQMYSYQNANRYDGRDGWTKQGFTNLDTFDFSKQLLGGWADFNQKEFENYNFSMEQLFLNGRAGIEIAYDYQEIDRSAYNSLSGNTEIQMDINKTIMLPALDDHGNPTNEIRENPNFGRPFLVNTASRTDGWNEKETLRATAYYKLDFEEISGDDSILKWLGSHTFSILADKFSEDDHQVDSQLTSFANDWDVAMHMGGNAKAREANTNERSLRVVSYVGDPVQSYINDPFNRNTNLGMSDIMIHPANYNFVLPDEYTMNMIYWNKGPDAVWPDYIPGDKNLINGNESWQLGTFAPKWTPEANPYYGHTEVESWAINTQSFFFNRHLVVNAGYREDVVENWLNTDPPKFGLDQVPDVSPEAYRWQDGDYSKINKGPSDSGVFGYGAVLHWPKNIIRLPEGTDVAFHYNFSENFVPDTSRFSMGVGEDRALSVMPSPTGESKDYGVTFRLMDRKLIVRLNWYENSLSGATSREGNLINKHMDKFFTHYSNLNRELVTYDRDENGIEDGIPNDDYFVDYGELNGETVEELESRWADALMVRDNLYGLLQKGYWQTKVDEGRLEVLADGSLNVKQIENLKDTEDIRSTGFEASITYNPTRNWRMKINVARQENIRSNVALVLTSLIQEDFLPFIQEYGHLEWKAPLGLIDKGPLATEVLELQQDFWTTKQQEGQPRPEVREWRVNFITNYSFKEGPLDGFSIGGAIRYQSEGVYGYPLTEAELLPGYNFVVSDIDNPYFNEELVSLDASMGYRTKILDGKLDWRIQLNLRNLQNLNSDDITVLKVQPDGSAARVRFDPPFQFVLTNSFSW